MYVATVPAVHYEPDCRSRRGIFEEELRRQEQELRQEAHQIGLTKYSEVAGVKMANNVVSMGNIPDIPPPDRDDTIKTKKRKKRSKGISVSKRIRTGEDSFVTPGAPGTNDTKRSPTMTKMKRSRGRSCSPSDRLVDSHKRSVYPVKPEAGRHLFASYKRDALRARDSTCSLIDALLARLDPVAFHRELLRPEDKHAWQSLTCTADMPEVFSRVGSGSSDAAPNIKLIEELTDRSEICALHFHTETQWNTSVHQRLLEGVLNHLGSHWQTGRLHLAIVHAVAYEPLELLPQPVDPVGDTKIDYALFLRPDEKQVQRLDALPARAQSAVYNRLHPIALNVDEERWLYFIAGVETKTTGATGEPQKSHLQLENMGTVAFQKLQHMCRNAMLEQQFKLPVVPLLHVQNDVWTLNLMVDGVTTATMHYDVMQLGRTSNPLGTLQVFRAIQAICEWADTDLRTWLNSNFFEQVLSGLEERGSSMVDDDEQVMGLGPDQPPETGSEEGAESDDV